VYSYEIHLYQFHFTNFELGLKNGGLTRPLICVNIGIYPFWIKKYGETSLKMADIVHDYGLYLPNHLNIDKKDIEYVCDKFKEVAIPLASK